MLLICFCRQHFPPNGMERFNFLRHVRSLQRFMISKSSGERFELHLGSSLSVYSSIKFKLKQWISLEWRENEKAKCAFHCLNDERKFSLRMCLPSFRERYDFLSIKFLLTYTIRNCDSLQMNGGKFLITSDNSCTVPNRKLIPSKTKRAVKFPFYLSKKFNLRDVFGITWDVSHKRLAKDLIRRRSTMTFQSSERCHSILWVFESNAISGRHQRKALTFTTSPNQSVLMLTKELSTLWKIIENSSQSEGRKVAEIDDFNEVFDSKRKWKEFH